MQQANSPTPSPSATPIPPFHYTPDPCLAREEDEAYYGWEECSSPPSPPTGGSQDVATTSTIPYLRPGLQEELQELLAPPLIAALLDFFRHWRAPATGSGRPADTPSEGIAVTRARGGIAFLSPLLDLVGVDTLRGEVGLPFPDRAALARAVRAHAGALLEEWGEEKGIRAHVQEVRALFAFLAEEGLAFEFEQRQSEASKLLGTRGVTIRDTRAGPGRGGKGLVIAQGAIKTDPYIGAAALLPKRKRRRPSAWDQYDAAFEVRGEEEEGEQQQQPEQQQLEEEDEEGGGGGGVGPQQLSGLAMLAAAAAAQEQEQEQEEEQEEEQEQEQEQEEEQGGAVGGEAPITPAAMLVKAHNHTLSGTTLTAVRAFAGPGASTLADAFTPTPLAGGGGAPCCFRPGCLLLFRDGDKFSCLACRNAWLGTAPRTGALRHVVLHVSTAMHAKNMAAINDLIAGFVAGRTTPEPLLRAGAGLSPPYMPCLDLLADPAATARIRATLAATTTAAMPATAPMVDEPAEPAAAEAEAEAAVEASVPSPPPKKKRRVDPTAATAIEPAQQQQEEQRAAGVQGGVVGPFDGRPLTVRLALVRAPTATPWTVVGTSDGPPMTIRLQRGANNKKCRGRPRKQQQRAPAASSVAPAPAAAWAPAPFALPQHYGPQQQQEAAQQQFPFSSSYPPTAAAAAPSPAGYAYQSTSVYLPSLPQQQHAQQQHFTSGGSGSGGAYFQPYYQPQQAQAQQPQQPLSYVQTYLPPAVPGSQTPAQALAACARLDAWRLQMEAELRGVLGLLEMGQE